MSKSLTPEQQRLILQAGLESLVADALMGYTDSHLGGGSSTQQHNGTGVWIDPSGNHRWGTTENLPFIAWKAMRMHGEGYPGEQAELRRLRAQLVVLQSALPNWPWGASPEELAAHKMAQRDNWSQQDDIHSQMKGLVRRMLAAGDPNQPIDLLEAAGLSYETVAPPARRSPRPEDLPGAPTSGHRQDLLF